MKKQPITNYTKLKNDWTIGMPDGYDTFTKGNTAIILDGDCDTVAVFDFKEDSVVLKKMCWQLEPKIHFDKKQIDILVEAEEDEE